MSNLLALAIDAAGGLDRWRDINEIEASVSVTGGLYRIKQQPAGMPDVRLRLLTGEPDVTVTPFPSAGESGRFRPDKVWIETRDGTMVSSLIDPRASFAGATLMTPWNPLQLLYFNSYAMWNYLTTPFLFSRPGFQTEELSAHDEAGESWRRLRVVYPETVPTHTREQLFYFNSDGLLQRIDYKTDVAGGVASHYVYDHIEVDGIRLPTLRRVVPRSETGPRLHGPSAVLLRIWDVALR